MEEKRQKLSQFELSYCKSKLAQYFFLLLTNQTKFFFFDFDFIIIRLFDYSYIKSSTFSKDFVIS